MTAHSPQRSTPLGRPRRRGSRVTSVQLSAAERHLLERIAEREHISYGEAFRRGLRLYAEQRGHLAAGEGGRVT